MSLVVGICLVLCNVAITEACFSLWIVCDKHRLKHVINKICFLIPQQTSYVKMYLDVHYGSHYVHLYQNISKDNPPNLLF